MVRPRRFLDGRASYAAKRRILEIVFLNCRLEDANLVPTMRKLFDVLVEGLLQKDSRGDWIELSPRCVSF
jgi:site-specific DNA recombinase